MLNFNYCNPTRILFGRDEHKKLGEALKKRKYRQGADCLRWRRALKNGTVSAVQASLKKLELNTSRLAACVPIPHWVLRPRIKKIAVDSQVDALLAIGGGSVIDTCKVAAAWAKYDGDAWDFFTKGSGYHRCYPRGLCTDYSCRRQ